MKCLILCPSSVALFSCLRPFHYNIYKCIIIFIPEWTLNLALCIRMFTPRWTRMYLCYSKHSHFSNIVVIEKSFQNAFRLSQATNCFSITKGNLLSLIRGAISFFSGNHMKRILWAEYRTPECWRLWSIT